METEHKISRDMQGPPSVSQSKGTPLGTPLGDTTRLKCCWSSSLVQLMQNCSKLLCSNISNLWAAESSVLQLPGRATPGTQLSPVQGQAWLCPSCSRTRIKFFQAAQERGAALTQRCPGCQWRCGDPSVRDPPHHPAPDLFYLCLARPSQESSTWIPGQCLHQGLCSSDQLDHHL